MTRKQPPIQVIVRAAARDGMHPRPVTVRYAPLAGESVTWWEFCAVGWHGIRAAALSAGLAQVARLRPRGCAAAWRIITEVELLTQGLPVTCTSRQLGDLEALELVPAIGIPRASDIAHQHYTPVADPKPRGREGAARKLARTALPASVTWDVATDILRMLSAMDDCEDKRRHIKFWQAALRHRGADGPGARIGSGGTPRGMTAATQYIARTESVSAAPSPHSPEPLASTPQKNNSIDAK